VARWMAGKAVGLVLSGGGSRGLAHLGVLHALDDAGLPIDVIGGTSQARPRAPQRGCLEASFLLPGPASAPPNVWGSLCACAPIDPQKAGRVPALGAPPGARDPALQRPAGAPGGAPPATLPAPHSRALPAPSRRGLPGRRPRRRCSMAGAGASPARPRLMRRPHP
jgi:hypothetical protein